MARTSTTAITDILGDHYDSDISLTAFIRTAGLLVDWLDDCDTGGLLTVPMLAEIEGYLAAHFYAHADQLLSTKSTGGASGTFQGQTQMVLTSTQYGQTAMLLDLTGCLAQRSAEVVEGMPRKAKVSWLGTEAE